MTQTTMSENIDVGHVERMGYIGGSIYYNRMTDMKYEELDPKIIGWK